MTRHTSPGRLLCWLLRAALPGTVIGRSIRGDLVEEYHGRQPGIARVLWLTAAAVRLGAEHRLALMAGRLADAGGARALATDVRAGLRALRRQPWVVALAVATLAVGVGSVTAMLAVLHGSLWRPLPFEAPERVVVLGQRSATDAPDRIRGNISLPNVRDLASSSRTLTGAAAYRDWSVVVAGAGDAGVVRAQQVDSGFFDVLGVAMRRGRGLTAADLAPGAEPVAVISEDLNRRHAGSADDLLGRQLSVDGRPHRVVGIVAPVTQLGNPQVWLPLADPALGERRRRQVYAVARLAPDATVDAAQSELAAAFAGLADRHRELGDGQSVGVMPIERWLIGTRGTQLITLLTGAVALVLVIACANAAQLMAARTATRAREFGMRRALGASRLRLLRALLVESTALGVAAGTAGALFAARATDLLVAHYGASLPRAWEIGLSPIVLLAAFGVSAACAALVTAVPAWRLTGERAVRHLGSGRTTARTFGARVLVGCQAALAMMLLAGAGLVVESVRQLDDRDLGVDTRRAAVFDVNLAGRTVAGPPTVVVAELLDRLAGLPGVTDAAVASRRPLFGGTNTGFSLPDRPGAADQALLEIRDVTADYFSALGVPVLSGSGFAPSSPPGDVLVNQAFERTYFADIGAVGQRLVVGTDGREFRIAAVVGDMAEFGASGETRPTAYWRYGDGPYGVSTSVTAIVRVASGSPLTPMGAIRDLSRTIDPGVAIADVTTLEALARTLAGRDRLAVRAMLVLASGLAILLTSTGLYGVVSAAVSRRRREIGLRRALGAGRRGVVALVMRDGLASALPGLAIGLLVALAAGGSIADYLYQIDARDPSTLAAALATLTAVVTLACWIPARRAARIEPAHALRRE